MRRTDIEAIGELAGDALAAGGGPIREMHEGIASRPFEILGADGRTGSPHPRRSLTSGVRRTAGGVENSF